MDTQLEPGILWSMVLVRRNGRLVGTDWDCEAVFLARESWKETELIVTSDCYFRFS